MRPLTNPTAEQLARRFHEIYETEAPHFGYKTNPASAVPWEEVPEQNRKLMIAVAYRILMEFVGPAQFRMHYAMYDAAEGRRRFKTWIGADPEIYDPAADDAAWALLTEWAEK